MSVPPTITRTLLLLAFFSRLSAADNILQVRHDHDPWGSCTGELAVSEHGIRFESNKESHVVNWKWTDIQTVDRLSPFQFSILSYKDQKWLLGRDRPWDFRVVDSASEGLSDVVFDRILENSPRPVVDRVPRKINVEYAIPVKHLHTLGGCEGILKFSPDWIVYETERSEDARSWRRRVELVNIWSTERFDLELEVHEREGEDLLRTRRYRFQLKEPLDGEYYTQMRRGLIPGR